MDKKISEKNEEEEKKRKADLEKLKRDLLEAKGHQTNLKQ